VSPLQTDLSVVEIAAKSGFTHAQRLNNAFKAATGYAPLRYRRFHRS
jgi:transcriptional regulator GlxA family with amidase domain